MMILLLIKSQRIQDAFVLLKKFENYMRIANNMNGLVWYYALGLDLLMETSFTAVSYKECDLFFLKHLTTFHKVSSSEAQSRFFANMLLWSARHGIYEMVQVWTENLLLSFDIDREKSINQTFTGLRVMEALTLQLVYAIDHRDSTLYAYFNGEVKKIEKRLSVAVEVSKCFKERLELHRIHFKLVKKIDRNSLHKLERLKETSIKNQNFTTFTIINHSQGVWRREYPIEIEKFWINHSTDENPINLIDITLPERIFPFSLPLPQSEIFWKIASKVLSRLS